MPFLTRDGVKLYYEEQGSGPPMVLVHGWTCSLANFAPQVSHFSPAHRCISIDLRGHGKSDAPEQDYTIAGFADDVAWMCDQLGVTGAVLVGHSMGAAVVLEGAARRPEICSALVMLDPAILFPREVLTALPELVAGFRSPDGKAVLREFGSSQFFLATSDPALKVRLLDELGQTPLHVVAPAFESVTAYDAEPALRGLRVPALYVEADPVIERLGRLREINPAVATAKTVGSGHFHQLEVPDQINAMIDRFLAVNARSAVAAR
jgi:pimeloyl-ACP methyl ester carboxylesterase